MKEIDDSAGLVAPERKRSAEADFKAKQQNTTTRLQADSNAALDDQTLAANMLSQAQRMEAEAKGMLSEAARMKKQAESMHPGVLTTVITDTPTPVKTTRGRKKNVTADAVQ